MEELIPTSSLITTKSTDKADLKLVVDAMRKAGLPE
jgi:hypothetical protein